MPVPVVAAEPLSEVPVVDPEPLSVDPEPLSVVPDAVAALA